MEWGSRKKTVRFANTSFMVSNAFDVRRFGCPIHRGTIAMSGWVLDEVGVPKEDGSLCEYPLIA